MSKAKIFNLFPYYWSHEDETDDDGILTNIIRVYGWNEKNESIYCCINDFKPFFWLELPTEIEWHESKLKILCEYLKGISKQKGYSPCDIKFINKYKLYYANLEKTSDNEYKNKKYPFLEISFHSVKAMTQCVYSIKRGVNAAGFRGLKFNCHSFEPSNTPVLKLFAVQKLPSSNWIRCKGVIVPEDQKESSRQHEFILSYKHMMCMSEEESLKMPIVYPSVLSFDLEAYSSNETRMPSADKPTDKVFQVGATLLKNNLNEHGIREKVYTKYLLYITPEKDMEISLTDPETNEKIDTRKFKTEADLYVGFTDLLKELDPDVVVGYNIFGWDIQYMHDRASKMLNCLSEFDRMGCISGKHSPLVDITWESSAYGKQEMKYLDSEGRLFIDLLPFIKRNYKLSNYKLETVCDEFLKTNKDDIKPKDIFRSWREKDKDLFSKVALYCCQDTYVVTLLYEKLLIWFDLVESATTNCVPIFYLYTKGQQIKMYSSVLKYCIHNDIIVQSNAYISKDDEHYEGAYVAKPKAGIYKMILPFDFASLYPSIIMAYNIDYSKLVLDESIPDECCHIFEWESHTNCPHDPVWMANQNKKKEKLINQEKRKREKEKKKKERENKKLKNDPNYVEIEDSSEEEIEVEVKATKADEKRICASYRYRFLKKDVIGKGVVPTLLEQLIKARKDTRKIIAKNEEQIEELKEEGKNKEAQELEEVNQVLDKRQLAYKVSANSMYGAMGATGKLPLKVGAMCVTARGRSAIQEASAFLEKECGGNVIYNDTDSAYTHFDCLDGKSIKEVWEYALNVVEKVKKLFPPPMKLEFEEKAYVKFLILTKKRYCAIGSDENGNIGKKLIKRGIVLQRRDNCKFLRDLYEKCIYFLLDNIEDVTQLSKEMTKKEILQNKKVQEMLNLILDMTNDLFQRKYTYKDFVITKGLSKLPRDYSTKTLPVHVNVAKNMQERGQIVVVGMRVEYLLLDNGKGYDKNEKAVDQGEDMNYYLENREVLRINYLEYFKRQSVLPVDELLRVALHLENFMEEHLKLRIQKSHVVQSIKNLNKPKFVFLD